jgi:hypothetical protein
MADEQIPVVNALLVQHGFHVMELSPQRESLEQVFLRLTEEARKQSDLRMTAERVSPRDLKRGSAPACCD